MMAMITCQSCGAVFARPYKFRLQKYCNHKCAFKVIGQRVREAAATKQVIEKRAGSRRHSGNGKGYIKRGGRHEHRLIVEQMLGRKLLPSEVVHHRDHQKSNNSPSNLDVMSRREHSRMHAVELVRTPRTFCKNGHPLNKENVRITSAGKRRCHKCTKAYDNAWKKAQRRAAKGVIQ